MDHKGYVGPKDKWDLVAAMQFNLLTTQGLRQHHTLLDIGCGSLRGGRLFIPYLNKRNYYGIEPNRELVRAGLKHEVGNDLRTMRAPQFDYNGDFTLTCFGRKFDYLLAQSIFSHATLDQVATCLQQAAQVMLAGSIFLATYLQGDKDDNPTAWVYPGPAKYTLATMRRVAHEAGLWCERNDYPHPTKQQWLTFTK